MRIGLRPDDLTACRAAADGVRLEPRPRLYGIGMGKTGTNVLASLFAGVPAAHEAEAGDVIEALLDYDAGRRDWRALRDLVVDRDRRLGLSVDVSNLNIFLVDLLVDLASDARFVLTIRDPWSWLDSIVNQYVRRPPTAEWRTFAEHRFGAGGVAHPAAERVLAEHGLHPLAGYCSYWRAHMEKALAAVPADRLLVVPVKRIVAEAARIAAFAGLPADSVDLARVNEYRNPAKRPIVQQIPRDHLEAEVRRHCGPLLERFFPGIRTPEDAGLLFDAPAERP
ncbi:MAG: sulfotransferase [Planctomycetaceae bacterium]